MTEKGIILIVGFVLILAGIFKWNIILAIFAWRDPPKTNKGMLEIRIVSVVIGLLAIATALAI